MGRQFTRGSSTNCAVSSGVVTGLPLTLAAWFKHTSLTNDRSLVCASNITTNADSCELLITNSHIVSARAYVAASATTASSGVVAPANLWGHAAAVFTSSTSRTAYFNGAFSGTNSASKTPAAFDWLGVGILRWSSGTTNAHEGSIAEVGVWDVALTPGEIGLLAAGVKPCFVRPQNLKAYYPLADPGTVRERNYHPYKPRLFDLSVTGATVCAHPPLREDYPATRRRRSWAAPPAAAGTGRGILRGGILSSGIIGGA